MSQTLFYRAQTTGNMWDTWLYWHEGTHYLFHLSGPGGKWYGISLATSTDGVRWREYGLVLQRDDDTTWLGTGSVWQAPSPGPRPRFIMNFSQWKGAGQTIFFAESDDLFHWQRLGPESEFRPDPRWYNATGGNDGRWDSINVLPEAGGGFHGWWTANPKHAPGLGFGESANGVDWAALPPPSFEWGDIPPIKGIEQGGIAEIGGKFYTMLGQGSAYWIYGSGMFTFVAEHLTGPFRPASCNYALLTSPPNRGNAYFTRFYPLGRELLVNHHSLSPVPPDYPVYFAPLKLVEVDSSGVLRLKWWPGNEEAFRDWPKSTHEISGGEFLLTYDPSAGMIVDATIPLALPGASPTASILLACEDGRGPVRFVIHRDGAVDVQVLTPRMAQLLERIDRSLHFSGPVAARVLVMHNFVELYLNEYLLSVQSLHPRAAGSLTVRGMEAVSCLAPASA